MMMASNGWETVGKKNQKGKQSKNTKKKANEVQSSIEFDGK